MAKAQKLFQQDLLSKSLKQLVGLRNELKKELFESKLALSLRKLNDTQSIQIARRNIARINTAIKKKSVA